MAVSPLPVESGRGVPLGRCHRPPGSGRAEATGLGSASVSLPGWAARLCSEPPPTSAVQPLPVSSSSVPPVAVPGCPPLSRYRGTSAVREPVGARACRRRGAVQQPAGCGKEARGSSPAVGVPCAGNRRSSAGEARSVSPAWDEAAPADRVRVGNFSPAPVPYKHFRGVSQVRRRKEC